jgi:hypothetical protein
MGRTHNTHGRHEKCIQIFVRKPKGKRILGGLDTDLLMILR